MKKINLEKIIVGNLSVSDLLEEYTKLKISIKDSNAKIKELKKFITPEDKEKVLFLQDNNPKELELFLLEKPMLSEYIDEVNYNDILNKRFEVLLKNKIDLSKLSNGLECQHEFIRLNNKLLCINCFIKEDDLDFQNDEFCDVLIDAAKCQDMFIDDLDESELGILEQIKMEYKSLIDNLKEQKEDLPLEDKLNIEEAINTLEKNKTNEYRKSLRKARTEKHSIR